MLIDFNSTCNIAAEKICNLMKYSVFYHIQFVYEYCRVNFFIETQCRIKRMKSEAERTRHIDMQGSCHLMTAHRAQGG